MSAVSPGDGIQLLNKEMQNLGLGGSSANQSGASVGQVHVQNSTEAKTVNKTETGRSRLLKRKGIYFGQVSVNTNTTTSKLERNNMIGLVDKCKRARVLVGLTEGCVL